MYPIKRILVGIDQSVTDETLIKYCAILSNQVRLDKIYFIHVAKSLELPKEILEKYPDLLAPVDENIEFETIALINKYFPDKFRPKIEVLVREGNRDKTILKEILIKQIDLLVMGHKTGKVDSGYLARKMAKLSSCSVALVTENLVVREKKSLIKKVLIPVDFSDNSMMAIELAGQLAGKAGTLDLYCQHIYTVPIGYHYSGKSYKEFAKILESNARKQMNRFLRKSKVKIKEKNLIFTLDKAQNVPGTVNKTVQKLKIDLVIIGSKGRTEAAALIMGSNSEKLVDLLDTSLVIVKDKGHNMDFLEALLNI